MWEAQKCTQNWNCLKNEGDMGVCTDKQTDGQTDMSFNDIDAWNIWPLGRKIETRRQSMTKAFLS